MRKALLKLVSSNTGSDVYMLRLAEISCGELSVAGNLRCKRWKSPFQDR
jgi:hypothetical protein